MVSAPRQSPSSSRPRSVSLVVLGVFSLGLVNIYRAMGLFRQSDLQLELGVVPDPRLRMIIAIIWAIIFLVLTSILWLKKPLSRILTPVLLVLYAVYRVALVVLFAQSEYSRGTLAIFAPIYTAIILFTIWALNRRGGTAYFGNKE
jgi:hypothetical protein